MATADASIAEVLSQGKHDAVQVNVDEIEPESPERLVVQSPVFRPKAAPPIINEPTIIGLPNHTNGRLRASSPTGSVRSSYSSHRHVVRRSRYSSGFSRSHRSEVSKELTVQAESEFFALMELMSGITRRSASLKEVWTKIISERESCGSEMDRLYERFEEYEEIIERHEKEKHSHHHEFEEQKKELIKLRLDLKVALSSSAEFKLKLGQRDVELGNARREISEFQDNYKYLKEEHEETKKTVEKTRLLLVESQEACRHAEEENKKHHSELRTLRHKYTELEASRTEISSKLETSHKEVTSLKSINTVLKKEQHEWMHEKGELEEEVRKCRHREDEYKRKVKELTELWEKKKHEVHELHEKVSKMKYEREELHREIKSLKLEIDDLKSKWDGAEGSCKKWKLKWEECHRELTTIREELIIIQSEHTTLTETITKKTEELKRVISEKELLEESYHEKCNEASDCHRKILVLNETITRSETSIKEKTETIHTLHERIERIESDRDAAITKRNDLTVELTNLQTSVTSLTLQLETTVSERESLRDQLHDCELRYKHICESVSEYHEGNDNFEAEIVKLRAMLGEARAEKERAIAMRSTADRERDESIARYEAKCREMDKLEEMYAAHMRGHGGRGGGGRRYISRSERIEGEDDGASVFSG